MTSKKWTPAENAALQQMLLGNHKAAVMAELLTIMFKRPFNRNMVLGRKFRINRKQRGKKQ